jgi:hypothetical protein
MKPFLPSGFMFLAGVLGIAAVAANADQDVTKIRKKFDLREVVLRKFFKEKHCPVGRYADVFVKEADAHGLDWRLLPSLSFVESTGGKHAPNNNNVFGWANGTVGFNSISDAIHQVATALSLGKPYRGKDLDGKLMAYNPRTEYKTRVRDVMRQISATRLVEAGEYESGD